MRSHHGLGTRKGFDLISKGHSVGIDSLEPSLLEDGPDFRIIKNATAVLPRNIKALTRLISRSRTNFKFSKQLCSHDRMTVEHCVGVSANAVFDYQSFEVKSGYTIKMNYLLTRSKDSFDCLQFVSCC